MSDANNLAFNDVESAMNMLKSMVNSVDPKLANPNIFNDMLQISPIVSQKQHKITKALINNALASIEDAKVDIEASKVLFEKRIYSRSVYSLQQCVEKACKAFGYALGIIKKQKTIGHISPNVFIEMLEDQSSLNFFLPLLEKYTQENQITKIQKAKEAILTKKAELSRINEDSLNAFLTLIESMKEDGDGSQKMLVELNKFKNTLSNFFPQISINIEVIMGLLFFTTALYVLAVITFPHWMGSRYSDTNDIKPKDYSENMPLVKYLPRMQGLTESAIESLEKYIKQIPQKK